ncbi:hypothetical protein L6R52_13145 [Myxococcota bacterium]|nr:hypothetical protein [Myxococcota bacterium]
MTNKKEGELTTFRIADRKRPEVRSFAKPTSGAKQEEAQSSSVGFPAVESRLEAGSIDDLVAELRPSYEKLEELSTKGDMKTKGAAKKAMGAYERTVDLFEYLHQTKSTLASGGPSKP